MKCEFKPTNNLHAFRMHFFQHYPVEQYWEERVRLFHNYKLLNTRIFGSSGGWIKPIIEGMSLNELFSIV